MSRIIIQTEDDVTMDEALTAVRSMEDGGREHVLEVGEGHVAKLRRTSDNAIMRVLVLGYNTKTLADGKTPVFMVSRLG